MFYLTDPQDIKNQIAEYAQAKTLWVDTELLNYRYQPLRLSLIQITNDPDDRKGDRAFILDVLDRPQLTTLFVEQIMANPQIEKVFHNASYDVSFLGKSLAKNTTCTWELAKKIPFYLLPTSNLKLKTLAIELCNFSNIPENQQRSDWGKRPLSADQLSYAVMDPVYVAHVHRSLLALDSKAYPDPQLENLADLTKRYLEIELQGKLLNSEIEHLQTRLQRTMQLHNLTETEYLKLSHQVRATVKANFSDLAKISQEHELDLDFPVTLPRNIRNELKKYADQLSLDVEKQNNWQISTKHSTAYPNSEKT